MAKQSKQKRKNLEQELKILNIDPIQVSERLAQIGAILQFTMVLREIALEHPKLKLRKQGILLRIRSIGDRFCELTMKNKPLPGKLLVREEIEIKIAGKIEQALKTFGKFGFYIYRDRQKLREEWAFGLTKIEIDTYPNPNGKVRPYVEIEGENYDSIMDMIRALKLESHPTSKKTASELLKLWKIKNPDFLNFSPKELEAIKYELCYPS